MLSSTDGSTVVERLEALDGDAHRLSYALLTDTPFGNCLTMMAVRDLGLRQAELEWSVTFEADGLPASEIVELMEGALSANCLALKQFMERRTTNRTQAALYALGYTGRAVAGPGSPRNLLCDQSCQE